MRTLASTASASARLLSMLVQVVPPALDFNATHLGGAVRVPVRVANPTDAVLTASLGSNGSFTAVPESLRDRTPNG